MTGRAIRSRENPAFRQLLRITASARERRVLGVSFIEGIHLCQAYLERHGVPRQFVHTPVALDHPEVAELARRCGSRREGADPAGEPAPLPGGPRVELAEPLFRELSQVENGVGIAFVIDTPSHPMPERIDADGVYLDGLQDPGNVGTILRTCAAVGVGHVFTAPTSAWCWSPKVLRAGMGAHFALSIHEAVPWDELRARLSVPIVATAGQARQALWTLDLRPACLWVFGAEGRGVGLGRDEPGVRWVSIPQRAAIESLNVGSAAAVCLYEQWRQREALAG